MCLMYCLLACCLFSNFFVSVGSGEEMLSNHPLVMLVPTHHHRDGKDKRMLQLQAVMLRQLQVQQAQKVQGERCTWYHRYK